jgi:hypothetical protein
MSNNKETLEQRQRLYEMINNVKDIYTKKVLYSQFISKYYPEAIDGIISLFNEGELHKYRELERSK